MRNCVVPASMVIALSVGAAAQGSTTFTFMNGGPIYAVSGNGATGAGAVYSFGPWPATWYTASGDIQYLLGHIDGSHSFNNGAFALTPDGSVAGGRVQYDPTAQQGGAAKWVVSPLALPTILPRRPGATYFQWNDGVKGLTADGVIAVGQSAEKAVIWNGLTVSVVDPWDAELSRFSAVTPDGARAVGTHANVTTEYSARAFMWTAAGGAIELPTWNSDNPFDCAAAISADGLTIVGYAGSTGLEGGVHLVRWRIDPVSGEVSMTDLAAGTAFISAFDIYPMFDNLPAAISADGRVIGAAARFGGPDSPAEAAIWTEATGLISVAALLLEQGALDEPIELDSVSGISADGRTLVGNSLFGSLELFGWSATITIGCGADFDGSGFVDFDDFNSFVAAFETGDISADFDHSGFVDFDDFNSFVAAFEAGC